MVFCGIIGYWMGYEILWNVWWEIMVDLQGVEVGRIDANLFSILKQCKDNWMKWTILFDLCVFKCLSCVDYCWIFMDYDVIDAYLVCLRWFSFFVVYEIGDF